MKISTPPNGNSRRPAFSADGKKLVFQSKATNLTDKPTRNRNQIYIADLETGDLDLISLSTDGQVSNGNCAFGSITADGTKVVFHTDATTLVPNDTNSFEDVFLRDLTTGATERISVGPDGAQGNSASLRPTISHDGKVVAFASRAKNLVPDDRSYRQDIFVRDLEKGENTRVNVGIDGREANRISENPQISGNGKFVVFTSFADNLVEGDTNGDRDVFVRDLERGITERVNVGPGGVEANNETYEASISDDGRFVAFYSHADNLVAGDTNGRLDVFVRDRLKQTTERVSLDHEGQQIEGASYWARISGDGTAVAFVSSSRGITEREGYGYSDIFVRDLEAETTERVSVGSNGARSKASSTEPFLSSDGEKIAFATWASNLVDETSRTRADVFTHDRESKVTERISEGREQSQ